MAHRKFGASEPDTLEIAGEVFRLRALPSGKAVKLIDNAEELSGYYQRIVEGIDETTTNAETISMVGTRVLESRAYLFAYGLEIDDSEDSPDFIKLKKALDDASWPEVFWALNQILEVNGSKSVEKMIKNLFGIIEPMIPYLQSAISASLKKFSSKETSQEKPQNIRDIGTTILSQPSEESPISSPQNTLQTA